MEEETIIYYESDPVVSQIMDLEIQMHTDIKENTAAVEQLYKSSYYNVTATLWLSSIMAVLVGIGLVLVLKRK